jgi:hypothetical protein
MAHSLSLAGQSGTRQFSPRLGEMAARFLKSTPLAQWHRETLQLDEADIIARAAARGLRLARATAINSEDYEVFDHAGRFLRRGSLSSMRYFSERYQG